MKKLIIYLVLISFTSLKAQKNEIVFHFINKEHLPKEIKQKTSYNTLEKAQTSIYQLLLKLQTKGYIESSVDSIIINENKLNTYLYIGKQYLLTSLENGNIEEEVLNKINFNENNFNGNEFSFKEIEKFQNQLLSYYENNGYPFAEVYLDSFFIQDQKVNTQIYSKKHQLFIIDTLIIEGNTKTKSNYLLNYLNINKGDVYNKDKLEKINKKLAQLSYIRQYKEAQLIFKEDKIVIHIFIENQKSNQFDLLIGVLPNDKISKRKVTITGDGKLQLYNSFGVGEEIYADFKQLKPKTQNLDLSFSYPFFLNLPIGVNSTFNLYKNDTSYININTKIGGLYLFNGADYLKLFYQNQNSNVLNYDTLKIKQSKRLPDIIDKVSNNLGLVFHFQNLDYIFNPRRGFNITFSAKVGTRNIKVDNQLIKINPAIYEKIQLKDINYGVESDINFYIPIKKRHSILIKNITKAIIAKNIFLNEKYKIGGAKILRGFDEEEINTPYFSVFSLEYHFSLSKNAYFYTFGDVALVEDVLDKETIDTPIGFGIGTTFETKGGIFSLSYALGKQLNNVFELKNGKIHFGYINLF